MTDQLASQVLSVYGADGDGEETYTKIVTELADISGYAELATARFLGIGHSGGAIAVWRMGYWKPERCFGVIGLRAASIGPPKHDPKAELRCRDRACFSARTAVVCAGLRFGLRCGLRERTDLSIKLFQAGGGAEPEAIMPPGQSAHACPAPTPPRDRRTAT